MVEIGRKELSVGPALSVHLPEECSSLHSFTHRFWKVMLLQKEVQPSFFVLLPALNKHKGS